jgi:hypothetical protein
VAYDIEWPPSELRCDQALRSNVPSQLAGLLGVDPLASAEGSAGVLWQQNATGCRRVVALMWLLAHLTLSGALLPVDSNSDVSFAEQVAPAS